MVSYSLRPDMHATQMTIGRWMEKENVVYTHNGLLSSLKKEGNPAICNMDEPTGHYTKQIEGQILHDSTYMRFLK